MIKPESGFISSHDLAESSSVRQLVKASLHQTAGAAIRVENAAAFGLPSSDQIPYAWL